MKYKNGFKYCRNCQAWFYVNAARCPVCHLPLRTRPRKGDKGGSYVDPEKYLRAGE